MKIFVVGFALLAASCAFAQLLPSTEYLPPGQEISGLEPIVTDFSGGLVDDGYRYKTVKRFRARHRRDVNELPTSEYLPPAQQVSYSQGVIPQVQQFDSVSQIGVPSNEYLAPVGQSIGVDSGISSGVLADDGYRYRTVKRYRARHRRDVNELPTSEYLPPVQQVSYSQGVIPQVQQFDSVSQIGVPSNEYLAPVGQSIGVSSGISSGVLADDGYRYRTVKRYRARHRRDVNELPTTEYLPPVQQVSYSQGVIPQVQQFDSVSQIGVPSNEYLAPVGQSIGVSSGISSGVLADDGYRYRTVKRYRARHRRDVNELPTTEYLPPVQQVSYSQGVIPQVQQFDSVSQIGVPSNEYLAPVGQSIGVSSGISSGVLADDGYRYRTVKRYRARHRRDVNELPTTEYLPPVQQVSYSQGVIPQIQQFDSVSQIGVPSNEYLAPVGQSLGVASGVLADDGYRYKTVRRFRSRHRRDVSELPTSEYLPPLSTQYLSPIDISPVTSNVLSGVLTDDGYRYKTVKKFRRRH